MSFNKGRPGEDGLPGAIGDKGEPVSFPLDVHGNRKVGTLVAAPKAIRSPYSFTKPTFAIVAVTALVQSVVSF